MCNLPSPHPFSIYIILIICSYLSGIPWLIQMLAVPVIAAHFPHINLLSLRRCGSCLHCSKPILSTTIWIHCLITSRSLIQILPWCTSGWILLLPWKWKQAELAGFPQHCLNTRKQNQNKMPIKHENIDPFLLCHPHQRTLTLEEALRYSARNWYGISLSWMLGAG